MKTSATLGISYTTECTKYCQNPQIYYISGAHYRYQINFRINNSCPQLSPD